MADISTSTVAYATRQQTGTLVFIASDGAACVLWCDGTNQKFSYAAAPYSSWTPQTLVTGLYMALGGRFRPGTDNIDTVTGATGTVRPNYRLLTKSGAAWSVGSANVISTTAAGSVGVGNVMHFAGPDPQGRYWIVCGGASTYTASRALWASDPAATWTSNVSTTVTGDVNAPAGDQIGNYLLKIHWNGTAIVYHRIDDSAAGTPTTTWAAAGAIANLGGSPSASSGLCFRAISSTKAVFAYSTGSGIYAQTYDPVGNAWSAATQLSSGANDRHPTIVTDGAGSAWVLWCSYVAANNYALVYKRYDGAVWDTNPTTLVASGTNIAYPSAGYGNATVGVTYTVGTGSPWTVGWATFAPPVTRTRTCGADASLSGGSRTITPTTAALTAPNLVGTSTLATATSAGASRLVAVTSNGDALAVWDDGTNVKWGYAASPYDFWTIATLTSGLASRWAAGLYQYANGDALVVYCTGADAISSRYLTYTAASHSWALGSLVSVDALTGCIHGNGSTIALDRDAQGRIWAAWADNNGNVQVYYTANDGASWTASTAVAVNAPSVPRSNGLAYIGDYIVLTYTASGGNTYRYTRIDAHLSALGSWSVAAAVTNCTLTNDAVISLRGIAGSAVGMLVGDLGGSTLPAQTYNASTDTWSSLTSLGAANDRHPVLLSDGTDLWCVWSKYAAANSYALVYKKWTAAGASWDANSTEVVASGGNIAYANGGYGNASVAALYTLGTATPWSVKWASFSTVTGGARTVGASAALLLEKSRTAAAEASLLLEQSRTAAAETSLTLEKSRAAAGTAALLVEESRVTTAETSLLLEKSRVAQASAALLVEKGNTVSASAPLSIARVTPTEVSLSTVGSQVIPAEAALLSTSTREVAGTAALLATGSAPVPSSSPLVREASNTASSSAALLQEASRSGPSTSALVATGTRPLGSASAALVATRARPLGADASLSQLGTLQRTLSSSATLSGGSRTVPTGGALSVTAGRSLTGTGVLAAEVGRQVPVSTSLLEERARVVGAQAALSREASRAVPVSASLILIVARVVPAEASLREERARVCGASAALLLQGSRRVVPDSVSLTIPVEGVQVFAPAAAALLALSSRQMIMTAVFIAVNAQVFGRSGQAQVSLRSGRADVSARSGIVTVSLA